MELWKKLWKKLLTMKRSDEVAKVEITESRILVSAKCTKNVIL